MTNKLFYSNIYLKEHKSIIESIIEKDGKFHVALKETIFYPEGGGQPSDKGFIDDIEVSYVYEEGDTIYHVLESKPKNKEVLCKLDFERRLDLMQQHTGQHLLSAVFYNSYDGKTAGFHLGEDYVTIDITIPEISNNTIKEIELMANQYIYNNLEVNSFMIEPEDIDKLPLRKLPPVNESIRIVEIKDVDYSPCCGTHLKSLGEIGLLKIIKTEKHKGMTRVYFKCGKRALLDFQNKHDITVNLSRHLSVPEYEIVDMVEKLSAELKATSREAALLKESLYKFEAQDLAKSSESKVISLVFEDKSFDEIQMLSKQLLQLGDYVTILISIPDKKIALAHSGNFDLHCGKVFKEHLGSFNGRGGGSDKQSQAQFQNIEDLQSFKGLLDDLLKNYR
jgi:alanyl-tRNA synthetase